MNCVIGVSYIKYRDSCDALFGWLTGRRTYFGTNYWQNFEFLWNLMMNSIQLNEAYVVPKYVSSAFSFRRE